MNKIYLLPLLNRSKCSSVPENASQFLPSLFYFPDDLASRCSRVVCEESEDDQRFVSCGAKYECGNMNMNISYPFWGGDRPDYCGHPGFELACDGEAPEFTLMEASYRVLDFSSSTNTVM